jgi:predicted GIY-YIG superfamily endonuclease
MSDEREKEIQDKNNKIEPPWFFYIIKNRQFTYAGVSPDPVQRLRKHNGEICGGAKYTASKGPGWKHVCIVSGFQNKIQALQFEWAVKHHPPRNVGGIASRLKKLREVMAKEKWTSKSPPSCDVPLEVRYMDEWETLID